MTDNNRKIGFAISSAIERDPKVKKMRELVEQVRLSMPPEQQDCAGLVAKEVIARHHTAILDDDQMKRALLAWAILILVEEAEFERFEASQTFDDADASP